MSSFSNEPSKEQASLASAAYSDIACRMGDETKIVEKLIHKLIRQIEDSEDKPVFPPERCITIPRRLSNSTSTPNPASHLTGQVWRWTHLKSDIVHLSESLEPLLSCEANSLMEICLNPSHYESSANPFWYTDILQPWASLAYHEKERRIGDIFQCQAITVHVNSSGMKASNLYCFNLATLPQPEDALTAHRRQQIGSGICLHYRAGQVFIEPKSDSDVFMQPNFYNRMTGSSKNTIYRLVPQRHSFIRVLTDDEFHDYLKKEIEKGVEAIYEMASLCYIRIAFGERWNRETPITEMNCWLEIKLKRHLSWLDKVLRQMGAPYKLHF